MVGTMEKHLACTSFEQFYASLIADRHLTERLSSHPALSDTLRSSLEALYERARDDMEFRHRLAEAPQETALEFIQSTASETELGSDELELVAGGTDRDSSVAYDVGYAIGSVVEWVIDMFSEKTDVSNLRW